MSITYVASNSFNWPNGLHTINETVRHGEEISMLWRDRCSRGGGASDQENSHSRQLATSVLGELEKERKENEKKSRTEYIYIVFKVPLDIEICFNVYHNKQNYLINFSILNL